jgi:hypothetical protein
VTHANRSSQSTTDDTRIKGQSKTPRPMLVWRMQSTTERSNTIRQELKIVGNEPRREINGCGQHAMLSGKALVRNTTIGS